MRSLDFSKESLRAQRSFLKENLEEMGMSEAVESFEIKAQNHIRDLIQDTINEEFTLAIGAAPYERTHDRTDTRKGDYPRFLTTTFGRSEIFIPRPRQPGKHNIRYSLFEKYQQRHETFDDMVLESLILGFSTRKQKTFFQRFIGDSVSHSTASKLLTRFQGRLEEFRTQPIEDKYKYLLIDGFWVKVKDHGKVQKKVIIFVMGITLDNHKEIIGFKLAEGEAESEVSALLNDLYRRGLHGKHLKVVASDGAKGIRSAIQMVFPYAQWQLCYVHVLRNLASHIRYKKKHRSKMMSEASIIYTADTKKDALSKFNLFCKAWKRIEPEAVRLFEKCFDQTLTFFSFYEDRDFVSSTNSLERTQEEIRRRIKTQGYFQSLKSVDLWTIALLEYLKTNLKLKSKFKRKGVPFRFLLVNSDSLKLKFAQNI